MKRIDFEIEICFPLILDSLFIFVFGFGFRGAAIATVISQFLSAAYVLLFLEKKAEMKARLLKKKELFRDAARECKKYYQPGVHAGFIMLRLGRCCQS
ncbi:MAG: polysaccharide biosynthesis C-terminal domain-containing protein [Ruminococcus sp.]